MNDTGSTDHYNLHKPDESERPDVSKFNSNMDTIDAEMFAKAKSWNGILPGPDGNITATTIPFAENLTSSRRQISEGDFIIRTAGGNASLGGGVGILERILGNRVHTGYSEAEIVMTVDMVTRTMDEGSITASIDNEAFLLHAQGLSTVTLTFVTQWSADPAPPSGSDVLAYYGLTVQGAPMNGDKIVISYTPENAGTITQSNPTAFTATGWNLYNHNTGYARVVKYSETYGFKISGAYDTIRFSEAPDGERSTINPDVNGNFSVSANGYVWITGGNNTNTAIWATWTDWTGTYDGEFEPYTENTISFTTLMENRFPYGLLRAGDIRDEIDFRTGQAYSKIERLDNNSTNLAAARNSGRVYEYDSEYIYLEKASYDVYGGVPVNNTFASDDHGIEFVSGTNVKVQARMTYSTDLKNKLERDVLTISAQTLTESEKAQARANIGAISEADIPEPAPTPTPTPTPTPLTGSIFKWGRITYTNLPVSPGGSRMFEYLDATKNRFPGYRGFCMMGHAVSGAPEYIVIADLYYFPGDDSINIWLVNTNENFSYETTIYIYMIYIREDLFSDYSG